MTRIHGLPHDGEEVTLDADAVAGFFRQRAARIDDLGPTRAVIYQDKHPDLAERRDRREKQLLLPRLRLDGSQRLLDIGCGTGRWVDSLTPHLAAYHGVDFADGLIAWAQEHHARKGVRFSVAPSDEVTLDLLGEEPFDRVLCAGVLIYLNHDALLRTVDRVREAAHPAGSLVLFREPVAQSTRLTIKDHESDELEQTYHAIYRTRAELLEAFGFGLGDHGWTLVAQGPLFDDPGLNNRAETRQEYFLWQVGDVA